MSSESGSASNLSTRSFPPGFVWGAATSSYQIEGAVTADGRGESIWDRFCTVPGAIVDGTSGEIACDHYHRWPTDVAFLRDLGLSSYRFSIAWPRIIPTGVGGVNERGVAFYDRLVDGLLEAGITPFATLYHWDLPQVLEDRGGWPMRLVPEAFAEYTTAVVERLGDRVTRWATINEPFVVSHLGYISGEHAPGRRSLADGLDAAHHVLLAHGLAVERIRAITPAAEVGIVLNFTPAVRASDAPAAVERHRIIDDLENRWFADAVAGAGYPAATADRLGWDRSVVKDGDLDLIAQPIDFLGVNYYTRQHIGAFEREKIGPLGAATAMGWEIHAPALGGLLRDLHARYRFPRYVISENGAAMPDLTRSPDGRVADADRIDYFEDHLDELRGAIDAGVPVEGYYAWSLLDNFEWAWGYGPKFGLVEVDPETQVRRPKQSALWYRDVARANALP